MFKQIINEAFGNNWAFYHGDCVFVARNLPDNSVDFQVYSPPFLALYIYSDSIADLGNTDSEAQFFEGYKYHLEEQYRILKPGKAIAIHCKDTMRYMSSHGYAGLYDFPGEIIRQAERVGFVFDRWITIWKDPVVEMQRTKTYGLLHMSFAKRAEVTRQGCADYVLILRKPPFEPEIEKLPEINSYVAERCVHQWTNDAESIYTPLQENIRGRNHDWGRGKPIAYSLLSHRADWYTPENIQVILDKTQIGRLTTIHCTARIMTDVIQQFQAVEGWKFHSRLALTDGSYLVTFRNWNGDVKAGAVQHNLMPPVDSDYQIMEIIDENSGTKETWREYHARNADSHPDYVGTNPPMGWRDPNYYSILAWQRYASPVWFDLKGLPETHKNAWMDINQTNVLNYRKAKSEEEEKHICPLQLDLIEALVLEYTKPGEVVHTSYGGIGSELVTSVKLGRKAIGSELKSNYWKLGCKNLRNAEKENTQRRLL